MRNKYKAVLVLALSLMLCSCADRTPVIENTDNGEAGANISEVSDSEHVMPVLSVVTADGDNKFATDPVDGYVSQMISTWTPGYKIPPEPYSVDCTVTLSDEKENVIFDSAAGTIKVRGNWTTNYDKKPFRLEFAEKQSMPGMNGENTFKNWILLSEYKDASMLRNKSALELSDAILGEDGLYASDAEFVEVYLNNEYWGVYLLAETQQINKNRVNITKAEKDYKGTDIGYLLEFDGLFFNEKPLQQFHVDYHDNAGLKPFGEKESSRLISCLPKNSNDDVKDIGFSVKNKLYSQEQHDFIASYVNGVYNIMYEAAYNKKAFVFNDKFTEIVSTDKITPEEAVRNVVDIDSLADMYIISELTCDADLYWSSFYMTADFGENGNKKLTFQAPWDFDSAMGNKSRCPDGKGFYASGIIPDVNAMEYETINPWLAVLSYEDWYQDAVKEKWTALYDKGVFSNVIGMIDSDTAKYSSAFERNIKKWGISTKDDSVLTELSKEAAGCTTQGEASAVLKEWLGNRVEFMNSYWHK